MGTQFDYTIHRLADLKNQTVELERRLSDARASFDREMAEFAGGQDADAGYAHDPQYYLPPYDEGPPGGGSRDGGRPDGTRNGGGRGGGARGGRAGDGGPHGGARDGGDRDGSHDGAHHGGPYDGGLFDGGPYDGRPYDRGADDGGPYDGGVYEGDIPGGIPPAGYVAPEVTTGYGSEDFWGGTDPSPERTDGLVTRGRPGARRKRLARGTKLGIAAGGVAAGVTVLVMLLAGGGASWPASVTTVQHEVTRACQNPDVKAEPTQVNFACAKGTRQILWVFALLTSGNDPNFADPRTGREGLEPITPAQGGEVAWSLNLHHPYDPANPVDSIAVAARALNNIIGGATLTGSHGNPVVQPGLEGAAANCVRYTGSREVRSRQGFPPLCAKPVTSPAGEAALVSDVYQKWIVGASPRAAQDAAVMFENARNPGDPRVQLILRHLRSSRPAG